LTLEIVHALTGHEAKIVSLSFDHNFQQLVSLGKDRTARVWQFDKIMANENRNPKITQKIKKGPVLALAHDKTRQRYVTSHENGELNVWNSEDNALLDQLISHNGPVRCLAIDRSGKIYSGGSDGALRIWNLEAKREPKTLEIHSAEMIQLKLSERSRLIATSSSNNELVIYDFTGIKIVMSTREEGRVNAIAFSQDEKLMAAGGAEKYVVIYEVGNSSSLNRTEELGQHSDVVSCMTFFGEFLLVVALKNGQVAIWNHQRASLIKKIENVSPIKSLMQFQKKYIVFTSEDGKVRIVNMDEGREVRVFRYSETPMAIDMNEDETLLLTGTKGGNIVKWNLNCVRPPAKKVDFDRKAIDQECTQIVTV
jgi:WD40 repeat protein